MTIYYTADTHFHHAAVIGFDNRPFASIEEHDETLVRNWNRTVRPTDTVYFVGDFVIGKGRHAAPILERLNGKLHLVAGNHDPHSVRKLDRWLTVQEKCEIHDGRDYVVLNHFAQRTWNKCRYGAYHLFGHSHGNLAPQYRSIDVGTNCWDYRPVSLAEIKVKLDALGLLEWVGNKDAEALNG